MATSSSDESITAPKDFHLSSSLDSGSRNSPSRQKCPLCSKFRKNFYCKECIHNGDFCNSSSHYSERYVDKQLRLRELIAAKKFYEARCSELLVKKQKVDELCSKIRQSKDRISILKFALKEKHEKQIVRKNELAELEHKNEKLAKSLPRYEEKVEELGCYVGGKDDKMQTSKRKIETQLCELKQLTKIRVQQLMRYIFPITIVQPKRYTSFRILQYILIDSFFYVSLRSIT